MQRYFAKDKIDDKLILDSSDMHHIRNVMRMKDSDEIECVYNKVLYICQVGDVNVNSFLILRELDDNNEMDVDVTIAISLVKEQKITKVTTTATPQR